MININKYFNSAINNPKPLKNGDIVKFSLVRRIDGEKALVNISGNKVIADFKNGIIEKGVALVSKNGKKIILTVLKNAESLKEAKENTANMKNGVLVNISKAGKENSETAVVLSSKGIKVNNQNIAYFETVLKYLPNGEKKEFFINSMKNNIYFEEEEIKNLGNIFNRIGNLEYLIKNSNKSYKLAEILKKAIFNLKIDKNNKEVLKNYINANGYFSLWFALFDIFYEEFSPKNREALSLILKILSSNRRNNKNEEIKYLIPIPFLTEEENELKEMLLYIEYIDKDKENKKYNFIVYEKEDEELCRIIVERIEKIEESENKYLITLKLFDKKLYKKCIDTKHIIESELKIFKDLKLKMEYENGI